MAFTVANFGGDALGNLAKRMVTFWATSAIFIFVFLGARCRAFGFSLLKFIRPRVVGVVLPAGYSFNLDGTAIYLTRGQDRGGPAPRSRG